MKKKGIFILLIVLLATNVSAISSNLKDSYEKRETAIAELTGSILANIPKENVELLREGHIQTAFEYDVKKLGNKYYFWLIAPQNEGNYTLSIKDILTNEQGQQKLVNYEKQFKVLQNETDYSIKPGAVFASSDFSISAILYNEAEEKINIDFPSSREVVLEQGVNKIDFSIKNIVETQTINIKFGKYIVPAYIVGKAVNNTQTNTTYNQTLNYTNNTNNSTNATLNLTNQTENNFISGEIMFKITPRIIKSTVLVSEEVSFPFQIINGGNYSIYNVSLDYNKDIFKIEPEKIDLIEANTSFQLNISMKNNTKDIRDAIIVLAGEESDYLVVDLKFTEKEEEIETSYLNGSSSNSLLYCSEIPGARLCSSSNEICSGQKVSSLDGGICCIGECEEEEKSKVWIGYLVIGIAILVLLLIYLKYKRTKPKITALGSSSDIPKFDVTRVERKRR